MNRPPLPVNYPAHCPQAVHETLDAWMDAHDAIVEAMRENLRRWFTRRFGGHTGGKWLIKAGPSRPTGGGRQPLLTPRDLRELIDLIRMHYAAPAAQVAREDFRWPIEYQRAWRDLGIIRPDVSVAGLVRDPITAGQLYRVVSRGTSLADMRKLASRAPMPRHVQLAAEFAEQSAARWITRFGQRLADDAATAAIETNRALAQDTVSRYLRGDLKRTRYSEQAHATLTPVEREALETDRIVGGWRTLSSELYHAHKDTDPTRDWQRVGWTETQAAHEHGRVLAMAEEDGPDTLMWREPHPGACKHCLGLYLDDAGRPRIFKLREITRNGEDNGGMNVGRRASKIGQAGGWLAVMGTTHPWCACTWHEYEPATFEMETQRMTEALDRAA